MILLKSVTEAVPEKRETILLGWEAAVRLQVRSKEAVAYRDEVNDAVSACARAAEGDDWEVASNHLYNKIKRLLASSR